MTPAELAELRNRVARARLTRETRLEPREPSKRAAYWRAYYHQNRDRILEQRRVRRLAA